MGTACGEPAVGGKASPLCAPGGGGPSCPVRSHPSRCRGPARLSLVATSGSPLATRPGLCPSPRTARETKETVRPATPGPGRRVPWPENARLFAFFLCSGEHRCMQVEPPSFVLTCRSRGPHRQAGRQTRYCRLQGTAYQMHLKKGSRLSGPLSTG